MYLSEGQSLSGLQEQLNCIRNITAVLASAELGLQGKMGKSLELLLPRIRAGQGSIMLRDRMDPGKFKIAASTRPGLVGQSLQLVKGSVSEHVLRTKQPLLVQDISRDNRFAQRRKNYATDSFLAVPLLFAPDQDVLGIINATDRLNNEHFQQSDLQLLLDYASWLTPWVQNSLILEELRQERDNYHSLSRELELKQKELLLNSQERAELVEMVVHDFKSPLSAIISNLDLLQYMGMKDKEKSVVSTARNGAENLLEMINEFLQMARLDSWQKQGQSLQSISLQEVLDQVLEEHAGLLQEKNIVLQDQTEQGLKVVAEKNLLKHLLQNLISNAIKYTQAQGQVQICGKLAKARRSLDPYPYVVTVCIQDNGLGVPEEIKSKIFKKFNRRGDQELDSKIQGSGIGLFICHRIVTMLQGDIWVEDVQPQGSRFCFTLFSSQE
ncbi:MAG: GAF domain-containing sensor histidine kinase [Desulfohalobiaceae bacterium]